MVRFPQMSSRRRPGPIVMQNLSLGSRSHGASGDAGMTTWGVPAILAPRRGGHAMDFADAPEHAAFRREFRDWLEANLSEDLKVEDAQDQRISPDREILVKRIAWQKKIHAAGWVGISWPKEYGGRGA